MASLSSSTSKSKKRKRVVLPIESKIDRMKVDVTQAKLADEYGIGSSTIKDKIVRIDNG